MNFHGDPLSGPELIKKGQETLGHPFIINLLVNISLSAFVYMPDPPPPPPPFTPTRYSLTIDVVGRILHTLYILSCSMLLFFVLTKVQDFREGHQ